MDFIPVIQSDLEASLKLTYSNAVMMQAVMTAIFTANETFTLQHF